MDRAGSISLVYICKEIQLNLFKMVCPKMFSHVMC